MTRTALAHLVRLGRWPRRIAALLCLLLAAASALSAQHPPPATASAGIHRPAGLSARLAHGQLAVPVTLSDETAAAYLRVGDRVDLLAVPTDASTTSTAQAVPVGDRLPVIAVLGPSDDGRGTDGAHLIVAADRTTAVRLATFAASRILAVLDKYP